MTSDHPHPVMSFLRSRKVVPAGIVFCCVLYMLCILALRYDAFRWGFRLESPDFSVLGLFGALYVPASVTAAFLGIGLVIDTARKFHSKGYLLLILLLPFSYFVPQWIPLPGFTEGVVKRLKSSGLSEELVAFAASEIARPAPVETDWERARQVIASPPFDSLKLVQVPHFRHEGRSLICRFGRSWGFSVSGVRCERPTLPSDSFQQKMVSPEIVVFRSPGY